MERRKRHRVGPAGRSQLRRMHSIVHSCFDNIDGGIELQTLLPGEQELLQLAKSGNVEELKRYVEVRLWRRYCKTEPFLLLQSGHVKQLKGHVMNLTELTIFGPPTRYDLNLKSQNPKFVSMKKLFSHVPKPKMIFVSPKCFFPCEPI